MTKVNRHRTYSMTPEWRIIAESLTVQCGTQDFPDFWVLGE
jgi:hypothetical protein